MANIKNVPGAKSKPSLAVRQRVTLAEGKPAPQGKGAIKGVKTGLNTGSVKAPGAGGKTGAVKGPATGKNTGKVKL